MLFIGTIHFCQLQFQLFEKFRTMARKISTHNHCMALPRSQLINVKFVMILRLIQQRFLYILSASPNNVLKGLAIDFIMLDTLLLF